jgi:hypothetical protein
MPLTSGEGDDVVNREVVGAATVDASVSVPGEHSLSLRSWHRQSCQVLGP